MGKGGSKRLSTVHSLFLFLVLAVSSGADERAFKQGQKKHAGQVNSGGTTTNGVMTTLTIRSRRQ